MGGSAAGGTRLSRMLGPRSAVGVGVGLSRVVVGTPVLLG